MIGYTTSLLCAIITFGMVLLQLSLTFGAPFGEYALGGSNKVLPKKMRFVSGAFSLIFIITGMAYLQRGKILTIGLSPLFTDIVIIINIIFLAYAIAANGFLTKSKKEKYVMTPVSIIQFILGMVAFFSTIKK